MGLLGSLKIAPLDRAHTSSHISIPYSKYVPILHRFWDIARYWSKSADLNPPHLYLAPSLGWSLRNVAEIFGVRKLESLGSWTIVWRYLCDPRFSHLCTTPTCDRRTDRRVDGHTMTEHINPVCDFLLMNNTNLCPISHRFRVTVAYYRLVR